jgi:hypothetical protein
VYQLFGSPAKSVGILLLAASAARSFCAEVTEVKPEPKEITHHLPRLSSVFPQGARPGTKTVVSIRGEYLDRAQFVAANDPAIHGRVLGGSYTKLEVELDVDDQAGLGPHYFRVITPRGASNVLIFRVGDLPHGLEHEPNSTFDQAEQVLPPVTINGRLDRQGDFDFFSFRAVAGKTWVFDLRAARNGNALDAGLILLDSRRRELARSEDTLDWDPFFTHTFAQTGTYCVVVQPAGSPDPNLGYQLDIRSAPHLGTVSPLRFLPGTTSKGTIFGAGILDRKARFWFDAAGFEGELLEARNSSALVNIRVPADAREGAHEFALITNGERSDTATFLIDRLPAHTGGESIKPPVSIAGTARYREPERFFFDADANQMIDFEVRAQRFGSRADSILRILDDQGKKLAENDEGSFAGAQANKDSSISYTFQKAGRYELQMRNLWALKGEDYPYELVVQPAEPGCELVLDSDQPYVYLDGGGKLKVNAVRKGGFVGPIKLEVSGLPQGMTADPAEIPPLKTEGEIHFRASTSVAGPAEIRVSSPEAKQPAWRSLTITSDGGNAFTPARFDRAVLTIAEKPLFALEPVLTTVNLVRGRSVEIPLDIQRAPGFTEDIKFSFENLPPGVTADPLSVSALTKVAKIRLHAAREAPPAKYPYVVILGTSAGGRVEEAPQVFVSVE